MRLTPPLAGLAAMAALAASAPAAPAAIVMDRSIDGVALDMTEDEAVAVRGPFDGDRQVGEEPSDYSVYWRDRGLQANFFTEGRRAYLVATTSKRQRTANGLGPGVTARKTRRRLRGERCSRIFDVDIQKDVIECRTRGTASGAHTLFNIRKGRVIEVVVENV